MGRQWNGTSCVSSRPPSECREAYFKARPSLSTSQLHVIHTQGALLCSVMHCTVLHCTVLYCTALYCTVLPCTALPCTALHCTVLHCTVLYCTAPWAADALAPPHTTAAAAAAVCPNPLVSVLVRTHVSTSLPERSTILSHSHTHTPHLSYFLLCRVMTGRGQPQRGRRGRQRERGSKRAREGEG